MRDQFDVVVAGGGPVGATLTLALRESGLSVALGLVLLVPCFLLFRRLYGANTALLLGDQPEALRRIRSFLEANPDRKAYVAADWMFEELQHDSAFKAMVDTTK